MPMSSMEEHEIVGDYGLSQEKSTVSKQFAKPSNDRYAADNSRTSQRSKGTRIYNYGEDDALNRSYVERIVR